MGFECPSSGELRKTHKQLNYKCGCVFCHHANGTHHNTHHATQLYESAIKLKLQDPAS